MAYTLPRWQHTLDLADVFHDKARTFEQRRDEIIRRIRSARWYDADNWTLESVVDELADTVDGDDFDGPWDLFYDYADRERIWVKTV